MRQWLEEQLDESDKEKPQAPKVMPLHALQRLSPYRSSNICLKPRCTATIGIGLALCLQTAKKVAEGIETRFGSTRTKHNELTHIEPGTDEQHRGHERTECARVNLKLCRL